MFSEEVEGYRRSLLYFARKCDWAEFKARAGRLFDYVESVEATELERRFFITFNTILALLIAAVVVLFTVDPGVHEQWQNYRNAGILAALAASGFELFFFLNFRWYADMRMSCFRKRREVFIRTIERDFRRYASAEGSRP